MEKLNAILRLFKLKAILHWPRKPRLKITKYVKNTYYYKQVFYHEKKQVCLGFTAYVNV